MQTQKQTGGGIATIKGWHYHLQPFSIDGRTLIYAPHHEEQMDADIEEVKDRARELAAEKPHFVFFIVQDGRYTHKFHKEYEWAA